MIYSVTLIIPNLWMFNSEVKKLTNSLENSLDKLTLLHIVDIIYRF